MEFKHALKRLPSCLIEGLDLMGQHKTTADLLFMAQHELDLDVEGDIELNNCEREQIRAFLRQVKA